MSNRGVIAVVVVGLAASIGGLLASSASPPHTIGGNDMPAEDTMASSETMSVYVSGWVVRPGVVQIPTGSLIADVIVAAGGAQPGANLDVINLAAPVADGDQIAVPGPGVTADGKEIGDALVGINSADAAELQRLPGVGPVLAERIISHREANGRFVAIEDLLDVAGIGEAKLASIRDLISTR